MTSRIHRGFHRIGVVLAVPMLLTGVSFAIQGSRTDGMLVMCMAVGFYAAARAVGWVLAGFLSANR